MRELGEFALIERINRHRVQPSSVFLGPGDDAAVVAAPDGRFVVTTDMLVQNRHFRLDWSSPRDIGRKAIAQNAADVVAMGAVPTAFVVGLGLPGDTPVAVVDGLADGMWEEAARAGGGLAGGDLVRGEELIISVTAFGDLRGRPPITRSGAREGDTVAVLGRLGWSGAGLAVLGAGHLGSEAADFAEVLAAHRVPQPPYAQMLDTPHTRAEEPATHGVARLTAMTDISDGLLADLGHIADASGVGIDLDSGALGDPALDAIAALLDADATQWILTGGEDHAFVGTWSSTDAIARGWTPIGRVFAGHGVTVDGVSRRGSGGWESFLGADSANAEDAR
ncbi:thiamine-phosphate kinase [Nocardia callitridis]|uniref:Thiamine-monophosphate kinase n=1 Tax=Nocardia callitridis TaxID=648753 RepID=A0ABP9KRG1_9NOCA